MFRSKRAERTKSDRKFRLIEMAFRLITNHISDVARETVGEWGGGGYGGGGGGVRLTTVGVPMSRATVSVLSTSGC